jgi:hypothetical protein
MMNTQLRRRQNAVVAAVAALLLGFAGGVCAQQANEVVGGSATDNTSAGNINGSGMPQVQQQGDVSFVSGGVGEDESKALQSARREWPLSRVFTGPGSDYLADVNVDIVDAHHAQVLNATSRGPYMLVQLPPGRYIVQASYKNNDQSKRVTIPANGSAKTTAFYWNTQ